MSNERLITVEGLATIRKNLTSDLTKPVPQQVYTRNAPILVMSLLHELDLADKREAALASDDAIDACVSLCNVLTLAVQNAAVKIDTLTARVKELESESEDASKTLKTLTNALRTQNDLVEEQERELQKLKDQNAELRRTQRKLEVALGWPID